MENRRGATEASLKGLPIKVVESCQERGNASSTEAVFGFAGIRSWATAGSMVARANIKKPITKYFFRSMPAISEHSRGISAL